jgi:prephenate dehydratase
MNSKQIIKALEKGIEKRLARLGGEDQEEILGHIVSLKQTIEALKEQGTEYDRINCKSGQKTD